MYRCEWNNCDTNFWSVVDLERHVRRHVRLYLSNAACGNETGPGSLFLASSSLSNSQSRQSLSSQHHPPGPTHLSSQSQTTPDTPVVQSKRARTLSSIPLQILLSAPTNLPEAEPQSAAAPVVMSSPSPALALAPAPKSDRRSAPDREIASDPPSGTIRLCAVCGDGRNARENLIVLCDGCSTPYHQDCHRPRINSATVKDEEAQWYCQICTVKK